MWEFDKGKRQQVGFGKEDSPPEAGGKKKSNDVSGKIVEAYGNHLHPQKIRQDASLWKEKNDIENAIKIKI